VFYGGRARFLPAPGRAIRLRDDAHNRKVGMGKQGAQLAPGELQLFAELLEYPDQQLLELLLGREQAQSQGLADVIERIRAAA
jgi:hypothetical protein